jgi:hypothetical protein
MPEKPFSGHCGKTDNIGWRDRLALAEAGETVFLSLQKPTHGLNWSDKDDRI